MISEDLQKKLSKKFEASTVIEMKFKGYDLVFKTDKQGNPMQLFIGRKSEQGNIKGERYTRTLIKDNNEKIIKDHWDLKGKAT